MRGALVAPAKTDAKPANANTETLTLILLPVFMTVAKKLPEQAPINNAGAKIPPGFFDRPHSHIPG